MSKPEYGLTPALVLGRGSMSRVGSFVTIGCRSARHERRTATRPGSDEAPGVLNLDARLAREPDTLNRGFQTKQLDGRFARCNSLSQHNLCSFPRLSRCDHN
jgi:hypothetical protein